jgi:succinoglycan biosynthesis transport protein ExoP
MRRYRPGMNGHSGRANSAEAELDLGALGRALWERKIAILAVTLVAAVGSFLAVNMITPRYKSEARVLIENRETAYSQPQNDRAPDRDRTLVDAEAVQSQVQLALSRDLARKIVNELKFVERPEFNPASSGSIFGTILSLTGLSRPASQRSLEERILDRYFERLTVYQVDRSRVIAIEFQSQDPEFAARVANAVAQGYVLLQQQAKQEAIRQANQWLSVEIDRLRTRVAEAESRVEEFRAKSNLYLGPNNNPLSAQQLGELNTQLSAARTRKADAETKARIIREILRSGRPVETSEVLNSELIRRLNEQRVTLKAQLAEQSSTLLELHPRIKELKAQIADLEAQTRVEAEKIARSFENDARLAAAQSDSILATLDQQKKQATSLGGQDVQLRALERDAKSQRDLLEAYLSRFRDTAARETPDAVPADARIISRAVASNTVHFPKKLPIVLIATFGALLAMIAFMVTGLLLRGDVYRQANSGAATDAVPVPMQPELPRSWIAQQTAAAPEINPLIEHVHELGRGIVVVTPLGHEASNELALELARDLAASGGKTLFVDLDVARPVSAPLIEKERVPGLADLLFGVVKFSEAIHRDPRSRAHIMGVGRAARDTAGLLSASRLGVVLGAVSQSYEYVILAAPDLAPLDDAARLARFSAGVLLIAKESDEAVAAAAADRMASQGFAKVAVVMVGTEPAADAPLVAA